MKIKKLTICNFRSYYGEKVFVFGDRLNLILGSNGDGKTTFFTALNWVLTPKEAAKENKEEEESLDSMISAKLARNLQEGETGHVYVSIEIAYDTDKLSKRKIVERGFTVTKKAGKVSPSGEYHDAFDCKGGEKGKKEMLLRSVFEDEAAFPAVLKKYHLFKGEDKLNIFDNKDTLQNLLDLYADVKGFVPFKQFAKYAEEMAEKALGASKAKLTSQARALEKIADEIKKLENNLSHKEDGLRDTKKAYEEADKKIDALKDDIAAIKKINELQEKQKEWKRHKKGFGLKIDEEYGRMLLDRQWILMGFQPILDEYNRKMSSFLISKQNIEKEHEKKQEEELDRQKTAKAKTELEKIAWKMQDVEKMKYMLHTHRCAICGTEAVEGSVTYDFIKQRIHDVIELLTPKPTDKEVEFEKYFSYDNIEELKKMGEKLADEDSKTHVDIEGIPNAIKAKFDDNKNWRDGIAERDELIEKAEKKIIRLNANSVSGVSLLEFANDMGTVNEWYEQRESASLDRSELQKNITEIKETLKKKREEQQKLMKATGNDSLYDVFQFFRCFGEAVKGAESTTIENLLKTLSKNANVYLAKLNVDDFTGIIRIYMDGNDNLTIDLQDRNEKIITNPNTSLLTTMHISILLSIAELAKESSENAPDYPLVFDAPTSSFDEGKDKSFYSCLNEKVDKQCIVVTKSYLYKNTDSGEYEIDYKALGNLNCKKYRIRKLAYDFDKLDIATIDIQVKEIKED